MKVDPDLPPGADQGIQDHSSCLKLLNVSGSWSINDLICSNCSMQYSSLISAGVVESLLDSTSGVVVLADAGEELL